MADDVVIDQASLDVVCRAEFRESGGYTVVTHFPDHDVARDDATALDADEDFATHDRADIPGICEGPGSAADVADVLREACRSINEAPVSLEDADT